MHIGRVGALDVQAGHELLQVVERGDVLLLQLDATDARAAKIFLPRPRRGGIGDSPMGLSPPSELIAQAKAEGAQWPRRAEDGTDIGAAQVPEIAIIVGVIEPRHGIPTPVRHRSANTRRQRQQAIAGHPREARIVDGAELPAAIRIAPPRSSWREPTSRCMQPVSQP